MKKNVAERLPRQEKSTTWTTFTAFGTQELFASDSHDQRMSASVVAPPRNHFRYNSLTVPV
jgi:hypothetical protein